MFSSYLIHLISNPNSRSSNPSIRTIMSGLWMNVIVSVFHLIQLTFNRLMYHFFKNLMLNWKFLRKVIKRNLQQFLLGSWKWQTLNRELFISSNTMNKGWNIKVISSNCCLLNCSIKWNKYLSIGLTKEHPLQQCTIMRHTNVNWWISSTLRLEISCTREPTIYPHDLTSDSKS